MAANKENLSSVQKKILDIIKLNPQKGWLSEDISKVLRIVLKDDFTTAALRQINLASELKGIMETGLIKGKLVSNPQSNPKMSYALNQ